MPQPVQVAVFKLGLCAAELGQQRGQEQAQELGVVLFLFGVVGVWVGCRDECVCWGGGGVCVKGSVYEAAQEGTRVCVSKQLVDGVTQRGEREQREVKDRQQTQVKMRRGRQGGSGVRLLVRLVHCPALLRAVRACTGSAAQPNMQRDV